RRLGDESVRDLVGTVENEPGESLERGTLLPDRCLGPGGLGRPRGSKPHSDAFGVGHRNDADRLQCRRVDDTQLGRCSERHARTLRETCSKSARSASSHAAASWVRTWSRIPAARHPRSPGLMVSARSIASACPTRSNGLTGTAHSPSSSYAPAFSDSTRTPSRTFTS